MLSNSVTLDPPPPPPRRGAAAAVHRAGVCRQRSVLQERELALQHAVCVTAFHSNRQERNAVCRCDFVAFLELT
jgi:hypothetical protein